MTVALPKPKCRDTLIKSELCAYRDFLQTVNIKSLTLLKHNELLPKRLLKENFEQLKQSYSAI